MLTLVAAGVAGVEALRGDARVPAIAAGAVLLLLSVSVGRSLRRAAPGRARAELWPDALVVHQPSLLREPLRIPRANIRAITVDDGDDPASFTPHRPNDRFVITRDFAWASPTTEPEAIGWLYVRGSGSLLPYCGSTQRTPNIAVVVDRPFTPRVRRAWVVNLDHRGQFPRLDRAAGGALLEACDPTDARAALTAWGPVRQLVEGDFSRVIEPPSRRRDDASPPLAGFGPGVPRAREARGRATTAIATVSAVILLIAVAAIGAIAAGVVMIGRDEILIGATGIVLGLIVGSTLVPPRVDTGPVGVAVDAVQHPRLLAAIRRSAEEMRVPMPDEVRITTDFEASIGRIHGRRILNLGLPLLAALDERELVGVVTHELAHTRGDDTCVWRAVVRMNALLTRWSHGRTGRATRNPARILMKGLHRWFVRQTGPILQTNEYAADAASAAAVGSRRVTETLSRFGGLELAYDIFWHSELGPALRQGYRPALALGFHRFCMQPPTRGLIAEMGVKRLRVESSDATLTHPTLRDRITAVRALRAEDRGDDGGPALTLLGDTEPIETALLLTVLPPDAVRAISPIAWEDVVREVHLPEWREHFSRLGAQLAGFTVSDLPVLAADPAGFAVRLGAPDGRALRLDDARRGAAWTIGAALAVALADDGFLLSGEPGGPVTASRGRARIRPFEAADALIEGTITAQEWRRSCAEKGVAHLPLVPVTGTPSVGIGS